MADASVKVTTSTSIAHIGSGASIAAGAFSGSADISTALTGTGNLARYPRADIILKVTPSTTTSSTSMTFNLYRRDRNVGASGNDDGVPGASNSNKLVGTFALPHTSSSSAAIPMTLIDVPVSSPADCEFYIQTQVTPTTPAGWTLTVVPKTDVGATT